MGLWDEAEKAKAASRAADYQAAATRQDAEHRLEAEQQSLIAELIAGFRSRGIAPQRYELTFTQMSTNKSYFPKKYVTGWRMDVSTYRVLSTDGQIVATNIAGKKATGLRVQRLPFLDRDSDGHTRLSGDQFRRMLGQVAQLHI